MTTVGIRIRLLLPLLLAPLALACGGVGGGSDGGITNPPSLDRQCSVDKDQLHSFGAGSGGIPALTNPEVVPPGDPGLGYLREDTRVVGVVLDGEALAVPFPIFWWHEVVNFDRGDEHVAVTRCPLTGSSLAFSREAVGNDPLVVSGLVYLSNLMLSTGEEEPTLIPQMSRTAACGPRRGLTLREFPSLETTWRRWKELHPETRAVSSRTGWQRNYRAYPYNASYDDPSSMETVVPVPEMDPRRPPKEVVLGIPSGGGVGVTGKRRGGGVAFPFGELEEAGPRAVVETEVDGDRVVVLWEAESSTAAAYFPELTGLPADDPDQGRELTLEVQEGIIRDAETGSRWRVDGRAVEGPLAGARLKPQPRGYTAFWFAWVLFQPRTEIWKAGG